MIQLTMLHPQIIYRSFPLDDLDHSRRTDLYIFPILHDLAHHVAGREPCNLHDQAHVSWVRICTKQIRAVKTLITADMK